MVALLDNSKDDLGITRNLHPDDSYDTPVSLATAALGIHGIFWPFPLRILDPGSGDFAPFGWAARRMMPRAHITAVEKRVVPRRDCYNSMMYDDYLDLKIFEDKDVFDLIIGNPPFSLAEKFIRQSISLLADDGHLLFLLKLRFLGSQTRANGLFREMRPKAVLVLPKRPSWWLYRLPSTREEKDRRKTTSEEYAFFLWSKEPTATTLVDWLHWDIDDAIERQFIKDMEIQL